MKRILLIEDDEVIGSELEELLTREGYSVSWAKTLAAGSGQVRCERFQLALVDINLPDGLGFSFCEKVRQSGESLPILFLTARHDDESAVRGLSMGAVDFLRKPFGRRELILRIQRQLKDAAESLSIGNVELDSGARRVTVATKNVPLTAREFDTLFLLIKRGGNTVTKEQLLASLDPVGELDERSLTTYVSRLKKKLKDAGAVGFEITPIYGVGYRIDAQKKDAAA